MYSNNISALRARRAGIIEQARLLVSGTDRKKGMSTADANEFDEHMRQADAIQAELNFFDMSPQSQRLRGGLDTLSGGGRSEREDPAKAAFTNYLKFGAASLNQDDRAILSRRSTTEDSLAISAAQGIGTGAGGGFSVPDEAMHPLVEAMQQIGGLLPHVTLIPSETGADLPIPTDDETAVEGEIITENTQHNEADIAFAQVVLSSYLYSSKIVRVSIQLADDAAFSFGDYVMKKLGERIGRITAKHWITGTGTGQPRGISVAATVGKTATSATAVTYDELVDLLHSVDPIHRMSGTWLMNDVTFASLRKLKDGQSRALYGDMANAAPNMLLGHKVSIDPNMPAMTTGLKPIIFGNLSAYYVRLVKGPRVLRLEERYADFAQLGFLSFIRADGDLIDTGAVRTLQMA